MSFSAERGSRLASWASRCWRSKSCPNAGCARGRSGPCALAAILNNLGVIVKVNRGNSRASRAERERTVATLRRAHESVVSFLLRALREATLKVAVGG